MISEQTKQSLKVSLIGGVILAIVGIYFIRELMILPIAFLFGMFVTFELVDPTAIERRRDAAQRRREREERDKHLKHDAYITERSRERAKYDEKDRYDYDKEIKRKYGPLGPTPFDGPSIFDSNKPKKKHRKKKRS